MVIIHPQHIVTIARSAAEADIHGSDNERVIALAPSSEAEVGRKQRVCQVHLRTRKLQP
jgi:hypothetical protein